MKKIIFAIFAHPDDEAFGPSGTLLMEKNSGSELHLVTLTMGQAGTNPDAHEDLGAVRRTEWTAAGKLLGASSMHDLGFMDGQLNNNDLLEAAEKIETVVTNALDGRKDVEIEFMTSDLNGISGHIDHIVAARAACLAFYRFKRRDARFKRIRLACIRREDMPDASIDWLYMEPGRTAGEIGETVDARQYRDEIIAIMRTHHTQRGDCETHIERRGENIGLTYFIVKD